MKASGEALGLLLLETVASLLQRGTMPDSLMRPVAWPSLNKPILGALGLVFIISQNHFLHAGSDYRIVSYGEMTLWVGRCLGSFCSLLSWRWTRVWDWNRTNSSGRWFFFLMLNTKPACGYYLMHWWHLMVLLTIRSSWLLCSKWQREEAADSGWHHYFHVEPFQKIVPSSSGH